MKKTLKDQFIEDFPIWKDSKAGRIALSHLDGIEYRISNEIHKNAIYGDGKTKPKGIIKKTGLDKRRYPMCKDQPAQIDCRVDTCIHYAGAGKCSNISPAITLNSIGTFVCWSEEEK